MSQQILASVEKSSLKSAEEIQKFEIGDTVDVHSRILEGDKERIQIFNGVVIARSGTKTREMFVVRRIVQGGDQGSAGHGAIVARRAPARPRHTLKTR